jgi:cell division transport system permease protein
MSASTMTERVATEKAASRAGKGRLRRASFDDLGLKRVLGDRMLPLMVAAMAFLAALALAGAVGAAALAQHWQSGAAAALTVQVPNPGAASATPEQTRRERVLAILTATPGLSAHALDDGQLADLLRPWLATDAERLSLTLPAVIAVQVGLPAPDLTQVAASLAQAAPGTAVESHGMWVRRLSVLARSLEACAWAALALVVGVGIAVIAIATRAGLAARRTAIEVVHGLGATDGYIAGRFARRASWLAATGGLAGALAALPVLFWLAGLAAPFSQGEVQPIEWSQAILGVLPVPLWLTVPLLPACAALIGFLTAQGTVRRWLQRLP